MTSDESPHSARLVEGGWELSWLPGQVVDRNQALSGMALAESSTNMQEGDFRWPLIDSLAAELGLTGPEAVDRVSAPLDDLDDARHRSANVDDADGWEQGEASTAALIPAAIAIALPLVMVQISLLTAVFSLLVSVILVLLAGLIHRENQRRHAQNRHAAMVLGDLTRVGGEPRDR